MAELIASTVSGADTEFNTKVPSLTQAGDIQEAFRLYHYGKGKTEILADPTPAYQSIHHYLKDFEDRIATLEGTGVLPSGAVDGLLIMGA
jgi:hypothetical protein